MDPSQSQLVHIWHRCHHCGAEPIIGRRYECQTCPDGPDNDLCERCHEGLERGTVTHPAEDSLGSVSSSVSSTESHRFVVLEGKPSSTHERWLTVEIPEAATPRVPDHFVVKPEFSCGIESFFGGHAFVVEIEGHSRPVVLTALHVMDELIKSKGIDTTDENSTYTGWELPDLVTKVNIYDVMETKWFFAELGSAGPMLALPHARTQDEEPISHRDIAAFWVSDPKDLSPGKLAKTTPEVGEAVWLAAKLPDLDQRTLKAVVVEATDQSLVFKFEDPPVYPKYASGAPVLNTDGDVVGINVGKGKISGQTVGHANHVGNIRRHLEEGVRL